MRRNPYLRLLFFIMISLLQKSYLLHPYRKVNRVVYLRARTKRSGSVRPSIDDVERISKGKAARRRGVGSRAVPHRLNAEERREWDFAKIRGFVELRGTGWRKERGDSPLANSFRNFCDASAMPYISIEKGIGINQLDDVCIDFSTMRSTNISHWITDCEKIARNFPSLHKLEDLTDIQNLLGWDNGSAMLEELVIWQIPGMVFKASFLDRKEAKQYAKDVVEMFRAR